MTTDNISYNGSTGRRPSRRKRKDEGKQEKKKGSFILIVAKPSPVHVRDTGGGIGEEVSIVAKDASTRHKLFFVFGTVKLNDF